MKHRKEAIQIILPLRTPSSDEPADPKVSRVTFQRSAKESTPAPLNAEGGGTNVQNYGSKDPKKNSSKNAKNNKGRQTLQEKKKEERNE
jgi:hypothetical protein